MQTLRLAPQLDPQNTAAQPFVPRSSIYLRDRLSVRSGCWTDFLKGKENMLRATLSRWQLVASAGGAPRAIDDALAEPSIPVTNVWELDAWDAVYEGMYRFTDTSWYAGLQDAIAAESQDLLVGLKIGGGTRPRLPWPVQDKSTRSMRAYLYEEVRIKKGVSAHRYLRLLNWFADRAEENGLRWVWSAIAITGRPGTVCTLWQAESYSVIARVLGKFQTDDELKPRHAQMTGSVDAVAASTLYPVATEQLDNLLRDEAGGAEARRNGIVVAKADLVPMG